MKPKWKSFVEFCLGIVATILIAPLLTNGISSSDWFWAAVALLALVFWINVVRNAWGEL